MTVHVLSLREFYHLIEQPNFDQSKAAAIISTSGSVDIPLLRGIRYTGAVYDDIDGDADCFGRFFSPEIAAKFAKFIRSLDEKIIQDLFCICDGGISRSAAVACVANIYFRQDDMPIWQNGRCYEPNPWVFRLLAYALQLDIIAESDIDLRVYTNRQAVRTAFQSVRYVDEYIGGE